MNIQPSALCFNSLRNRIFWLKKEIKVNLLVSDKKAEELLDIYIEFCISAGQNVNIKFAVPRLLDCIFHQHAIRTRIFEDFFRSEFSSYVYHQSEVFGSRVFWSAFDATREFFLPKLKDNTKKNIESIEEVSGCYIVLFPCK